MRFKHLVKFPTTVPDQGQAAQDALDKLVSDKYGPVPYNIVNVEATQHVETGCSWTEIWFEIEIMADIGI